MQEVTPSYEICVELTASPANINLMIYCELCCFLGGTISVIGFGQPRFSSQEHGVQLYVGNKCYAIYQVSITFVAPLHGGRSDAEQSRHINIRFIWCAGSSMCANVLDKLQQGSQFAGREDALADGCNANDYFVVCVHLRLRLMGGWMVGMLHFSSNLHDTINSE